MTAICYNVIKGLLNMFLLTKFFWSLKNKTVVIFNKRYYFYVDDSNNIDIILLNFWQRAARKFSRFYPNTNSAVIKSKVARSNINAEQFFSVIYKYPILDAKARHLLESFIDDIFLTTCRDSEVYERWRIKAGSQKKAENQLRALFGKDKVKNFYKI